MQKRGQVAVFVIVGIIIVILAGLIFVGRKEFGVGIPSTKFLQSKLEPIRTNLDDCVKKSTDTTITRFLEQGGDLEPLKYVFYQNRKVKYLCYNVINSERCVNMMPNLNVMIEGLNKQVNADIKSCVNKKLVDNGLGYEVKVNGQPETKVMLIGDSINLNVKYDVSVIKGENVERLGEVDKKLDVPIVDLYNAALDVVNAQAKDGFFEQLFYMLDKKGKYIINVEKSPSAGNVGDIVYKINKKDDKYQFWFAVEGDI